MQVRPFGEGRLTEALDERGENLLTNGGETTINNADGFGFHQPSLALSAALEMPTKRGAAIAMVRGTVPVDVQARRLEPIEVPMDSAAAPTSPAPVWCGDVTFISARMADTLSGTPVVELVVQPEGWSQMSVWMFRRRFRGGNDLQERLGEIVDRIISNVAVVDGEGRGLPHGEARSTRPMPDGLHLLLPLSPPPGSGPPARIHYHGTLRETMNLEFEFHNIPTDLAAQGR